MIRSFIAIEISSKAKEKIFEIEQSLLKTSARLSVVDPENSHITLKFIGDVDNKQLDSVKKFLSQTCFSPYTINLKGLSLNSQKSPRVIWINGYDEGESSKLASIIEEGLLPVGMKKETRPFKIHATVARIKSWDTSAAPVIKSYADEFISELKVSGFKLKKSTLTPKGPVYEDLMEVTF
ncbi:MAG: RNA 2',3'-cyclic phosphodiesterase [Methanomicrobium sp.]|nr:RNA 2',3'-cyclic phosphodiesterase [Methanomicrobium sp.]